MAQGDVKGEEYFTRILKYIHEPSRLCMQKIVIKRAFDLKPPSETSWDLDRFIQTNRSAIDKRKYRHHRSAFFPPSGKIDSDTLDTGQLCILLFNVCDLKGVPAIENSLNEVKDIRNHMSHPGRFSLTLLEYDSFKERCEQFIDIALNFIKDDDFSKKIRQDLVAIKKPLHEETIAAYKTFHRETRWGLMEFQGKFEDFTEAYSTNIENDNAHRREHVNFMNCQKKDTSELKDGMHNLEGQLLERLDKLLEKVDGTKVPVPETKCTILVKHTDPEKEKQLSRAVVNLINNGTDGSCENCQDVSKAVEAMRNTDYGPISNGKVACIQLDIHCRNLTKLRKLIDDVISGKIQELIKPLESALRKDFDCPELELEFIIDRVDFLRCMDEAVKSLERTLQNDSSIESIGGQSEPKDRKSSSNQNSSQMFARERLPDGASAAASQHRSGDTGSQRH